MKRPPNLRRLNSKEILQERDILKLARGLYIEARYHNTPLVGEWIGCPVGKHCEAFRKRNL